MKIHDIESRLGISKDNIRFYEKEGLLQVKRDDNDYRNYSSGDLDRLKKMIVLRRSGVSISDIKKLFAGEASFEAVLASTRNELEKKRKELDGSLFLCKEMKKEHFSLDIFMPDIYCLARVPRLINWIRRR